MGYEFQDQRFRLRAIEGVNQVFLKPSVIDYFIIGLYVVLAISTGNILYYVGLTVFYLVVSKGISVLVLWNMNKSRDKKLRHVISGVEVTT